MFEKGQLFTILLEKWLACPLQISPVVMKRIRLSIILGILPLFLLTASHALGSQTITPRTKMLFFYQQGCRWCAQMDKVLREPGMEKLLLGHARVVRINVRGRKKVPLFEKSGMDLAREFQVYGTPTIILMGRGERVLLRIPGALSEKDFHDVVFQYVPGIRKE